MSINEIQIVSGSTGVSHNGTFRGKDLGTVSSLNEYIAFRSAHGIDDKSYKDLYLGDYFQIVDGTYNVEWMVAHIDYYHKKDGISKKGVVLIPKTHCATSKMNNTNTAEGGYKSTIVNTTVCPAIATALQTVLGSYLLTNTVYITNSINTNFQSMCGGDWFGASSGWEFVTTQCILPNEIQIYGARICSSSMYDVGESCEKLAVFNFISHCYYEAGGYVLRDVMSGTSFASAFGFASRSPASAERSIRPLIYIG